MISHIPRFASYVTLLALIFVAPVSAMAQAQPELPKPSPQAQVMQQVGLTEITVAYSSPALKGRVIWGKLVPYSELWRNGANTATTITFSTKVKFAGKAVDAGTYALYTIPGAKSWTAILNKNAAAWGTRGYDKSNDVARVTVKTSKAAKRERMSFVFSNTTDSRTRLDLEWDTLRVSIPIEADTNAHALANIKKVIDGGWSPHARSATYLMEQGDLKQALVLANTSIAIKDTWSNYWIKAQLLAKQGHKTDALAAAQKAQALGGSNRIYGFYKKDIATAVAAWKKR